MKPGKNGRKERIYRLFLRLFPFDFRREYGSDMEECFRQEVAEVPSATLWWRTLSGFLKTAPLQHWDVFRRDLRQSARSLYRNPLMASIAVLVLALGIGANTALFSEINLLMIRPLPVPDPEKVARVVSKFDQIGNVTFEQYLVFRNQNRSFLHLAAFQDK